MQAIHEALSTFYMLQQENGADNQWYLHKFQLMYDTIDSVSGSVGNHPDLE